MKLFGPYKKKTRSASMQLSINAIVILVMAMAVLGLGLGIIKGIRGKADKFLDFNIDLAEDASAAKPIANINDELSWKAGKENQVGIGFYNSGSTDCSDDGAWVFVDCGDLPTIGGADSEATTMSSQDAFSIVQRATRVKLGEPGKLLSKINPDSKIKRGSYACSFQVYCGGETGVPADGQDPVEEKPVFVNLIA